jgi:hypothetical protein
MPIVATKVIPKEVRELRRISLRRMLTDLMRADVLRRLGFYGTLCGLIVVSALIYCGNTGRVFAAGPERIGLPWDWSHEHLLFSKTDDPAVLTIIQQDPRAFHQWLRRNRTASQGVADGVPISLDTFLQSDRSLIESSSREPGAEPRPASERVKHIRKRDWGVSLGATQFNLVNAINSAPSYPAKYNFDINATPSCENDFVTFPTGANGATSTDAMSPNGQASIIAFNQLYASQGGTTGFCGLTGPSVYWAYINAACPATTSSDPILSSPVLSLDGTKVAWVTTTGKVQIVTYGTGATVGGDESVLAPACIGSAASGGDGASLQTLTLGNATHNPTSGVRASEIFVDYTSDSAYVGDNDGYLHKISPFFTAPGALQEIITAGWQASHAYSLNSLILDSNGFIEKCTTAGTSGPGGQPSWSRTWNATTTDNTVTWTNIGSGGGWPIYVTGSSNHLDNVALNGPIFDFVSKNVFVGDQNGSLYYVLDPGASPAVGSCVTGRVLYPCVGLPGARTGITAAGGSQADCATANPGPTCLVMSNQQGFTDGLVVDTSDGLVMTQFSDADGTNATVEQTNTSLSVFNSTTLAGEVNSLAHHTGAFDNNYYSDPASGYYYVCAPGAKGVTDLYRVGFTNTSGTIALGSVNGTPLKLTTTGSSGNCSPLTEIYNAPTAKDWLFLSLDNHGKTTGCDDESCVVSLILLPTMVTGLNKSYGPGVSGDIVNMNGTGGMVVDNDAPVSNTATSPITAASESGTTATITTSTTLGVVVGQNIKVSAMAKGYTGYNTASAAVTCVGASCATGATASSISYTANPGLASCPDAGTCAGKALGIAFFQASSFYFMPVASNLTCGDGTSDTGCGVKLTQADLN